MNGNIAVIHAGGSDDFENKSFFDSGRFHDFFNGLENAIDVNIRIFVNFKSSGFDSGEIKQVVYQSQQGPAAVADDFDLVLLDRSKVVFSENFAETDDSVHWCSDMMAHACKEFTFRTVRFRGLLRHRICIFYGNLKLLINFLRLDFGFFEF
ncbi:MAG: hypothetical protein BWY69_00096 [Planctomycetes bacterium ADurb.Bin401]|nr:MAG: hypothetical protein BWY69_00096 [Planctomycetes bacterium ADurb.Bin401]